MTATLDQDAVFSYGVATISRLLEIIGFFCRIQSLLWGFCKSEKEGAKKRTAPTQH